VARQKIYEAQVQISPAAIKKKRVHKCSHENHSPEDEMTVKPKNIFTENNWDSGPCIMPASTTSHRMHCIHPYNQRKQFPILGIISSFLQPPIYTYKCWA
jgi:hypothetical protein